MHAAMVNAINSFDAIDVAQCPVFKILARSVRMVGEFFAPPVQDALRLVKYSGGMDSSSGAPNGSLQV